MRVEEILEVRGWESDIYDVRVSTAPYVLIGSDGSATVIDWTRVGVADRRIDVALDRVARVDGARSGGRRSFPGRIRADDRATGTHGVVRVAMAPKRLFTAWVIDRGRPVALGFRPEARRRIEMDLHTLAVPWLRMREITGIDVGEAGRRFEG